ncbi:hypothetical protein ACP4OV_022825 [Aristida adscensionis]
MGGGEPPLRELVARRAASFLRAARLVLTGGERATPAPQLFAEEEEATGGVAGGRSRYRSVSTEDDDDVEGGGGADEPLTTLLPAADDDADELSRMTSACEHGLTRDARTNAAAHGLRHWPAAAKNGAFRQEDDAAAAEESAPLVPRRAAAKRANAGDTGDDHPFGCDRRGRSAAASASASPLLVSS